MIHQGIIPAHAGKTARARERGESSGDHPRSRGENHRASSIQRRGTGSSPLTRGKRGVLLRALIGPGIIPAHAGKTLADTNHQHTPGDHPRSRGENGRRLSRSHCDAGSSPLTRGKRARVQTGVFVPGIIPAHAGKSQGGPSAFRGIKDHPRSRGENATQCAHTRRPSGSSPLTRGKLRKEPTNDRTRGIIPAHAGKTSGPSYRVIRPWDHPRSRGENPIGRMVRGNAWGSSPLTRGKHRRHRDDSSAQRIIPAHAGKTDERRRAGRSDGDHPRSRGEN